MAKQEFPVYRPESERAPVEIIRNSQWERLNRLLAEILPANRFYQRKLGHLSLPLTWERFHALPFTTKMELVCDQETFPPLGAIATYDRDRYVTYHQTSGTTGRPLIVLDTPESWSWWSACWQYVYRGAGVTRSDRIFLAFSFGPFIGFWSALEGARQLGAMTIPGGGMDSKTRLRMIRDAEASVLLSTVTYALHLEEVARLEKISLPDCCVRITIHAGEPGASIPSIRARIENAWGARCYDHAGATEVGAYGYPCEAQQGLHVNEWEFIAEILDPHNGAPVAHGDIGELVITNLGRPGWPVIRYRTGDLVRAGGRACACGRSTLLLSGGIIGRADDLMIIRGVNVYPSAVEAIVRMFDVAEFRILRQRRDVMEELLIEVEADDAVAVRVADALRQGLGIRISTRSVPHGSLPRSELKARRIVDCR
ncbi:MAG TPA: phenylacetate--CoA ligase family protein [Acidobacteriota bacterium]